MLFCTAEEHILQTARIYSKATGKSTLLAVCSRDSMQVLPVRSINGWVKMIKIQVWQKWEQEPPEHEKIHEKEKICIDSD